MEVESIVVDEISKDRTTEQSSYSPSHQSTVDQRTENMAATASQGPLRFFQDTSSIATAQFYSSAELAFTNKPATKTERVKKRRYSPPSTPHSQSLVQEERKMFTQSAQIAPFSKGFGDSSSFPRLSGLVVCPHLHPLAHEPDTTSSDRTSKYYSAATFITAATTINEEKEVVVHQLDTRSEVKEESWSPSPLTSEHTDNDEDRNAAADRYSTSPPPLPAPYLDSLTSTEHGSCWSTSGEDPAQASCSVSSNTGMVVSRTSEQALAADSMQEAIKSGGGTKSSSPGRKRRLLHRPLARQRATRDRDTSNHIAKEHLSPPNGYADDKSSTATLNGSKLLLISPEHDAPVVLGKTKPVPPPKTPPSESDRQCKIPSPVNHQSQYSPPGDRKQSSSPKRHPTKILHSTTSSPAILSENSSPFQRSRLVSFHNCKAGETLGQFKADYLGSREVDGYVCVVNSVAKQLVDQRPAEVIAYVSSQKIRLAPSKNESVLFKSFAVKDILMVEKCTINKRIIGIIVWKFKTRPPTCHILRCPDEIISKSFYEAVWEQSQIYDDVSLNKISCSASPSPSHSPSHQLTLSDAINDPPNSGTESSTSSNSSTPSYREMTGFSATEVLHKFPATYIGSAVAGKLHSIDDVIQKVLIDKHPSLAKELHVCLSLAEVKLVEVKGDQEVVCMSHETSRIRAIGVYSQDKRFMGYIIKEEGKPLTSYVLRCNSAALMVSLVSFLRQSCQLTSFQRGGSFYDELAADDGGDDCDYIIDGSAGLCDSLSIVRRLRSLTTSLSQRTYPSLATVTRPSFQSHTQLHKKLSPANNDIPQRKRDSIVQSPTMFSPFDFTDEDYAKFSLTYIGSAALDPPLSQQSVLDALRVFGEQGTAAGQAAIVKNSIDMQVSALGINLSDRKRKLFINRNYPRKQLEGYCAHPIDDNYFAFASRRPGYSLSLKVHVFKRGSEKVKQILDAIQFWLEIDPTTS